MTALGIAAGLIIGFAAGLLFVAWKANEAERLYSKTRRWPG
ncbi:gas vesicle protein [Azospirillum canadense]|nr:gas vesicle protein [Azospirillum canadense]